jgi:hypothetical protein
LRWNGAGEPTSVPMASGILLAKACWNLRCKVGYAS